MATAGSAAAAEQDGIHTIYQTITCHYHVYAPTTVHVGSHEPRCVTQSSSEAVSVESTRVSRCQRPVHTDVTSVQNFEPNLEAIDTTRPEGKRQAVLQWLVLELMLLLQKVSR